MIKKNDILLASYSFLAALTENGSDIYKTVYIPLCKRALSNFAQNHTSGKDTDIQDIIRTGYGIEIPLLIIRNLIKAVVKDLSRNDKNRFGFEILENAKSFKFKSFSFAQIESTYDTEKRRANALQLAFEKFIDEQNEVKDEVLPFATFIDKNKQKISSFFAGKVNQIDESVSDKSFMLHVRFLQYIETNNDILYKTVEHIFIGSIIASYLEAEIDVNAKLEKNIAYYLDTQIVLEALNLQGEEDSKPTIELIKLIQDTGGNVRLLDITVDEIHTNIETAINNYDKDNPTTTINEACIRIGKSKTWLIHFNGQLEKNITDLLKINIDKVLGTDIEKYSKTEDAQLLKDIWRKKHAALHDVIAYLYIRNKRKSDPNKTVIQKAKYWFITANKKLCDFNISRKINGYTNEIIMPEELTSLLFLQNPKVYSKKVSNIGLNELIAQTLSEEYPSKELINEFDSAIATNADVSPNDYNILLASVSKESTTKIQKLLDETKEPKKFNQEIHTLIEKERNNQRKIEKERTESQSHTKVLEESNKNLSTQLNEISKQIEDLNKNKEQEEKNRIKERKQRKITNSLFIAIVIILLIFFVKDRIPLVNWLNKILTGIAALGGLWSFIALCITIYNIKKRS